MSRPRRRVACGGKRARWRGGSHDCMCTSFKTLCEPVSVHGFLFPRDGGFYGCECNGGGCMVRREWE